MPTGKNCWRTVHFRKPEKFLVSRAEPGKCPLQMPTWHQTQTMFKYLTPSWHPMSVDYHNSIIIEGPDTADAVSSTKSYFFPWHLGKRSLSLMSLPWMSTFTWKHMATTQTSFMWDHWLCGNKIYWELRGRKLDTALGGLPGGGGFSTKGGSILKEA